ncbi:YhcB family protein [Thalassotalea sp. PLHSN55]|uniref:YhcB family protein n=1 Tax=Thalassotalea sp. PLHSN55 TaxID=3435888 RepID=UPI003F82F284
MSVGIGLIIFIIGAIAGFVISKLVSSSAKEQKLAEQASQSEAELQQYKQDVAEHLESSAKLLEQMNTTCQNAMSQMAQSTKLLKQATPAEGTPMPFFSKETQEQLAETVSLRHQRKEAKSEENLTEPPLDYSGNPSGLFRDEKHSVTNPE